MIIYTYSVMKTLYSIHDVSIPEYGHQKTIELKIICKHLSMTNI